MVKILQTFHYIMQMPRVTISLKGNKDIYDEFTRRHPRYPLFRKKTIGVALLPIVGTAEEYLESINGKNSAAYYARKAERKGYVVHEISPNDYIEDIYAVNVSKSKRQGREMKQDYLQKKEFYELRDTWKYFGVINAQNKLVAYAWVPCCGQTWILNTLLGHGDFLNDGIMYLLITRIATTLYLANITGCKYLMYDTIIGAQKGLKDFKLKCGFRPYRVKWTL